MQLRRETGVVRWEMVVLCGKWSKMDADIDGMRKQHLSGSLYCSCNADACCDQHASPNSNDQADSNTISDVHPVSYFFTASDKYQYSTANSNTANLCHEYSQTDVDTTANDNADTNAGAAFVRSLREILCDRRRLQAGAGVHNDFCDASGVPQ